MMLYYFVEFAGSFANIALLLLFIGRLFPKKEPVSRWFYAYVALLIAGQCALSLFPDWVTQRTIYLLVGGFFLALLFYEVRPWQAVFASGAFFTLIALVEVLAMLLIGLRIPDTDILMQAGAARLVYVVFSNLIQIPLVVLISHFFSRKGNALRILWLLPIIAIQIASIAVCYVAQYHAVDEYFPDYMVGLMAVLLLINILIVFYVEALRENELEKFKVKFNEQQYNLQMEYYQQLKERQEEVRSLRHDVKKYILAMQAVAEHGDTEELHKIAQAATDVFERSTNISAVGNPVVDALLNYYLRIAERNNMEDIKSGKINCIIVKDLSRLGRNYIEMGKYLEQIFPMMGIRFIAINDNYDNANTESSDSDSIVVPFKNLLNDSYCRDISIKVRSQLDIKRRKGEFIGGYAMYGYCKDERNKSRLVVDEYAADVVRSIYRRKLEGMSAKVIAEQLNSEGVLAPSEYKRLCGLNYHSGFKAGTHAKWQAIQVLRILKNEVYTGTMVQGKRQKINYKIKKIRDVEESGWIKVPNMHEAIIPQKLFDTVQEVLKLDTCASKGQQTVNLFSGMVRCGGCGQNMVRRTVSKNGKKYVYLHCITNHNGLGCSSHLISESKLAEVVLAALQGKIQQISGLEQRLDEINEIPKNQRRLKSVEEHMKMLEQEEQKYQTLRRQLYEDMSSGIVSKDEYKEFSRSFNEKVENICKAKTEMNRQLDSLSNLDVEHLPWIEDFKSYQNLTSLNRRVLVELVESITVYDKEHIHIQYRFDQEIRNVLEYCNSVPTTETEGSTV